MFDWTVFNVFFIYFLFMYLFEEQKSTFTTFCNNNKTDTMIR